MNNAPSGSTIRFAQNVKLIKLTGDLVIGRGKQLTIVGPGASQLAISGGNNAHIHVSKEATLYIFDLSFKDSETVTNGFLYNEGRLTITNSVISNNKTTANFTKLNTRISIGVGGSVVNSGILTVINSIISGNEVTAGWGGGIYNSGMLTLTHSTVSHNTADEGGGGIENYGGNLILINSTVSNNRALGDPRLAFDGGIANTLQGTLTITSSTISDNTASGSNGGIGSDGGLTLINSTVSGNTAYKSNGGIGSDGRLTLINSTVSGNTAFTYAGGIFNSHGGTLILTNSTISRNSATTIGGGIFNQSDTQNSSADLTFSTIYNNSASVGSDIMVKDGASNRQLSKVKISNSIIAGDPVRLGPDISGTLISSGYNLFQSASGANFDSVTREPDSTDKILSVKDLGKLFAAPVELRNNGGPTMTYMLGSSSPAIGAIPLQSCQIQDILDKQSHIYTDQRGMKRPSGSKQFCDIGAYESQVEIIPKRALSLRLIYNV